MRLLQEADQQSLPGITRAGSMGIISAAGAAPHEIWRKDNSPAPQIK